jgi:hypothetical protein
MMILDSIIRIRNKAYIINFIYINNIIYQYFYLYIILLL